MKGVIRLAVALIVVLGAEALFFSRVGVPDRPELHALPQIVLSLSALLVALHWSGTRLPASAESPRWPSKTSSLPLVDPEWDQATGRLASLFIRRRRTSLFAPDSLAEMLTSLMRDRGLQDARDMPRDLRAFLDAPHAMPSTRTLGHWLDWVEAHP